MSCRVIHAATATAFILLAGLSPAQAAIVYIDAESGAAGNTVNNATASTTDWVGASGSNFDNDWFRRTSGAADFAETDVWETVTAGGENAPLLKTTVTGLISGTYDVYVYYGNNSTNTGNWAINAGLSAGSLAIYNNGNGTINEVGSGSFTRFRAKIASNVAVLGGSLDVFIDNAGDRTYYDGIGYEFLAAIVVPAPGALPAGLALMGLAAVRRRRLNA